ncbi:MAG TPA: hypothetical protein VFB36_00305 [Nevskiaceae bacterium]|nr:hypothetical protein [Nevskiaceae bacterium]
MLRKLLLSTASAATVALTACGGGGGVDTPPIDNPPPPPPPPATQYRVTGPLDAVQAPVSSQVFGQLESATDGTPLKALLVCADNAINFDALDIADTIANALQSAAASGSPNPAALASTAGALNSSVNQLANDLQGMLNALAGSGGCGSNGQVVGIAAGTNPLAGTPLSPLGVQMQGVLYNIRLSHPGSGGTSLSLDQLAGLTALLHSGMDAGVAGIAPGAPLFLTKPVAGGVVSAVQTMLRDVDALVLATSQGDTTAVRAALNTLLADALANSLTQAVPLSLVEQQGGQVGAFTGPVLSGSQGVADLFSSNVGTAFTTAALKSALAGQVTPVIDPIATQVLPVLSDQFILSLHDLSPATLGNALNQLTVLLGPVGGVGQPVATVLSLIVGAVQSGAGGTTVCPSSNPLLNILCGL